jgi:hypothetical protein
MLSATKIKSQKQQSISEQINEILQPNELIEEKDDDEVKIEKFKENSGGQKRFSEIRKKTSKYLSDLDDKYKGRS